MWCFLHWVVIPTLRALQHSLESPQWFAWGWSRDVAAKNPPVRDPSQGCLMSWSSHQYFCLLSLECSEAFPQSPLFHKHSPAGVDTLTWVWPVYQRHPSVYESATKTGLPKPKEGDSEASCGIHPLQSQRLTADLLNNQDTWFWTHDCEIKSRNLESKISGMQLNQLGFIINWALEEEQFTLATGRCRSQRTYQSDLALKARTHLWSSTVLVLPTVLQGWQSLPGKAWKK